MGPVQFPFGIGPTDDRFLHVWMSKPSIVRRERGIARSDIAHISTCVV